MTLLTHSHRQTHQFMMMTTSCSAERCLDQAKDSPRPHHGDIEGVQPCLVGLAGVVCGPFHGKHGSELPWPLPLCLCATGRRCMKPADYIKDSLSQASDKSQHDAYCFGLRSQTLPSAGKCAFGRAALTLVGEASSTGRSCSQVDAHASTSAVSALLVMLPSSCRWCCSPAQWHSISRSVPGAVQFSYCFRKSPPKKCPGFTQEEGECRTHLLDIWQRQGQA